MKPIMLLVFIITMAGHSFGQTKKNDRIKQLFEEAEEHYQDSAWNEAVAAYRQITKIARFNSADYSKAWFNMGYTRYVQGKDSAAAIIFMEILDGDSNEEDAGGRGSGIMQEPYALYKHNAAELMARIELRRQNYTSALEYIQQSHKQYPYKHFCGNELAASAIYTAELYGQAYLGLKDTTTALRTLLPHVFDNGLASNMELIDEAVRILNAKYDKTYLISQLTQAIEHMQEKTNRQNRIDYTDYQIEFLGVTIPVYEEFRALGDNKEIWNKPALEKRKLAAKNSEFFKKLQLKRETL